MAVETGPSAAILIDFDNICLGLANSFGALAARNFALSPQTWLSWFASGGHADGQTRRFIVRRAYMNADSFRRSKQLQSLFASGETRTWSSEDYDDPFALYQRVHRAFASSGFEIADLQPVNGLRANAAVRIAVDALELLDHATRIEEFVFLTGDSDLSAVLPRLRAHGRRTALLCDTGAAASIEGLVDHVVRPEEFVRRAFEGKTAARALIETVERALQLGNETQAADEADDDDFEIDDAPPLEEAPSYELLPRVARRIADALQERGEAMETIDLLPIFREFPEFSQVRSDQNGAWFGAGGLSNLVRRLAALEPRLKMETRGSRATRSGRLVDRVFVTVAPVERKGRRRAGAEAPATPSVVDRALEVIKDEVARSQTPLHMAYLRLQVLEELGAEAAAAGLADVSGKALKDAALRYGLAPFRLVEPRDGYVLVMDPARHQMPE
jgi:hypothetical protein